MRKRLTKKEISDRLKLLEQGIKFCPNCNQNKKPDDFARDPRHYDGLQTYCKYCCNELRRTKWGDKIRKNAIDYYNTHPKVRSYYTVEEKQCSLCKETKPADEFGVDRRKSDGLQSQCISCQKELRRTKYAAALKAGKQIYRQNHLDEIHEADKARMKQWVKDNPGQHRANCHRRQQREELAGPHYTGEQWETLLNLCDNKCLICGCSDNIEADHVIPVSKGGTNDIGNIQPLCKSCNCSKHNIHNTDYRPEVVKQWAEAQRKD